MAETKSDGGIVKLYKKILEVKKSVAYLQKKAKGGQYDYVSSSQVLGAVNAKMNELGLLLTTEITRTNIMQFQSAKGANQFLTEADMIITWVDTETGVTLSLPFYAQGVDNAEKGVGKFLTYGEKYFILKQLNVATDKDDPDKFQEENASAEDLKAAQEDRKKKLIASIGKCTKLEQVTKIWTGNPDLKKDKEFAAAVKKQGEKLKAAEEIQKQAEKEDADKTDLDG